MEKPVEGDKSVAGISRAADWDQTESERRVGRGTTRLAENGAAGDWAGAGFLLGEIDGRACG
ncbi:hypothetical protein TIFTF001_053118 [Ficus carica]|uniref:Uncharacterized protein n=1 Tax=Ficus carica TaxID=3494 RepID=A0AA88EFR9_FICCA|nr:hypothetical protein TIFTF001_053118 [Ficus carica]